MSNETEIDLRYVRITPWPSPAASGLRTGSGSPGIRLVYKASVEIYVMSERSQHANRDRAMRALYAALGLAVDPLIGEPTSAAQAAQDALDAKRWRYARRILHSSDFDWVPGDAASPTATDTDAACDAAIAESGEDV